MAQKYYAVRRGRHPGIYRSWGECQKEVSGFSGAQYKSFLSKNEANEWLKLPTQPHQKNTTNSQQLQLALNDLDQTITTRGDVISLYTDGGSRNHGNRLGQHVRKNDKAAWAFLVVDEEGDHTGTGGEYGCTNNRMEITALIQALRYLIAHQQNTESIIATLDSHYVLDPITKGWLYGWQRRGWKTSTGTAVANQELWQEVLSLLPQFTDLHFKWTKGHAANRGNVIVDELLNTTMDKMK